MNNRPQQPTLFLRRVNRAWVRAGLGCLSTSWLGVFFFTALLVPNHGCSLGSGEVAPPDVDPQQIAAKALEQLDQDSDGHLTKEELQGSPGMLRAFSGYDANRDEKVDSTELTRYFELLYSSEVGLMSAGCSITNAGRPVVGATVRFIPEAFLGDAIHAGEGITDRNGHARVAVPDENLPESHRGLNMMQVGIYRVEVEPSPGEIATPKRPLGMELNPTSRQSMDPTFDLAR